MNQPGLHGSCQPKVLNVAPVDLVNGLMMGPKLVPVICL